MQQTSKRPLILASACALLFAAMAVWGWIKLQYGFNMIDEGMYMTDGWRLAAGDHLFPDSSISAAMLYAVFNALIFHWLPDITLLGFRQIQYAFALAAIAVFAAAIYQRSRRPWLLLLTLSVFAFTGLDVAGISANLSYYTYPHLFFVLHQSLLLFALNNRRPGVRATLFVLAGVALWAVGFSLLPLSGALIIPLLVWCAMRYLGTAREEFSFKEMLLVTAPGIVLWAMVVIFLGDEFFTAVLDVLGYTREGGTADGFDRVPQQYVAVTAVFAAALAAATYLRLRLLLAVFGLASALMFLIVSSNGWGWVAPFWQGWFSRQMWFCSLLIVAMAALLGHLFYRKRRGLALDQAHLLLLVLVLPSALLALLFSRYSNVGVMVTSYVALPVCMATALFVVMRLEHLRAGENLAAAAVASVLLPFYFHLARADWEFTFFDLPPRLLTRTLSGGFGAGIHTSEYYEAMTQWMTETARANSAENDLAVILDQAPMGYMIIKRRPALNHSWGGWALSNALRRDSVAAMLRQNRQPKIAYRFLRAPILLPVPNKEGEFRLGDRFRYSSKDPVSVYVITKMQYQDTFYYQNQPCIELYVSK
ncbi:MAG: hypothetical protein K8S22_15070 [Betaproteobacteria bacterium]|nr:hypothetical protein [Betaproteobacteria bacterium]